MKRATILLCLVPFLLTACNTTRTAREQGRISDEIATLSNGGKSNVHRDVSGPCMGDGGVRTVYFDYDTAQLRADALETLQKNAALIKTVPDTGVLIAGHCDERGTQEYNLALGQTRAERVRDYLVGLGIPREQLATISYGEEYPADSGHTESAWAQNRRCDFRKN